MKHMTVGELKEALKDVPDDLEVILESDSGVDYSINGQVIIESAEYVQYWTEDTGKVDYFQIYANDCEEGEENE